MSSVIAIEKQQETLRSKVLSMYVIFVSAVLFSLFTVFIQVTNLSLAYLQSDQLDRHRAIIEGVARSPYQYRVLSEYLVESIIRTCASLGNHSVLIGFISFRLLQNLAIFLLLSTLCKRLDIDQYITLLGMSILAWAMTHSLYDSDLAFNTYTDVICYLTAALVILSHRYTWLIATTALAALNRETSGLIPLLLLCYIWFTPEGKNSRRVGTLIAVIAWVVYAVCFFGLRMFFGTRELALGYGHRPGLDYFVYNITRPITYVQLFGTLGLLPLMSIISFSRWPSSLRAFFWAVAPIWMVVHPFVGIIAETRYFLVPLTLVFIPGTLLGISSCRKV